VFCIVINKERGHTDMLQGSPKQVSWAKRIRQERLISWKQSDPLLFQEVESKLTNELSASWWICHRERELKDVLEYIGQGGGSSSVENTAVKTKAVEGTPSASTLASTSNQIFSSLDDVHRNVGELRDVATGKVVVDPECPF
jgi:hypothetical protein